MAGVKEVKITEDKLSVLDCGQTTPVLYDIPCTCEDGTPDSPPPVQSPDGSTPCRVANYISNQILSNYFEKFIPVLASYGTGAYGTKLQNACNNIGLSAYVIEFQLWAFNLNQFVGINNVITQYHAWGAKQTQLQCWLLGCLPSSGEMSDTVKLCWRMKMADGKTDFPPYAAVLEALYGFTSIIPLSRYQELANIGSTIPASCQDCESGGITSCSTGVWTDWRQVSTLGVWTAISGAGNQYPISPVPVWQFVTPVIHTSGLRSPSPGNNTANQPGIGITRVFDPPIRLCKLRVATANTRADGSINAGNSSAAWAFYTLADGVYRALASDAWSLGDPADRDLKWDGQLADVTSLHIMTWSAGNNHPTVLYSNYNDEIPVAAATITGAPYVAIPVVSVPANVSQAGFDALFNVESAGRIYEFEGEMPNLTITPRAGDAFRTKVGQPQAKFTGSQTLSSWTQDQVNCYYATYSRTINKAGAGGNGLVDGIYQINDDANYPRAHWMIMARYRVANIESDWTYLRHVSSLVNCRAGVDVYFVDEATSRLYINTSFANPAVLTVEVAHTKNAFVIGVDSVTLENLLITGYAPDFQQGMVQTGSPLTIGFTHLLGCNLEWSACNGAKLGTGSKILDNLLGVSGMATITMQGENLVFSGNIQTGVYNELHTNEGYEGSLLKGSRMRNAVITGNTARVGGDGKCMWDDLACIYTLYQGNVIENSSAAGLFGELGFRTRFIENRVLDAFKGRGVNGQPQYAGIAVVNTQGYGGQPVLMLRNIVTNFGDGGGCWGIMQSNRGSTTIDGVSYTYLSKDVTVEDNDFYCRDLDGTATMRSGLYRDYDNANFDSAAQGLVINNNRYHHNHAQPFQCRGANQSDAQWKANTGGVFDPDSTFDAATVPSEVDA